jgi:AAA+ superfamily predicted ATPase
MTCPDNKQLLDIILKKKTKVANKDSGLIYEVVKAEGPFVFIKRLDDSKKYRLNISDFFDKYNPLSKKANKNLRNLNELEIPLTKDNAERFNNDIPGIFINPDKCIDESKLILNDSILNEINIAIHLISTQKQFKEFWMLEDFIDTSNKCVLNFYGPPGTGKTLAARYIANKLNKKIFQVKYEEVISKFIGDTAKHIAEIFDIATRAKAILFLDEADSLLSRRINMADVSDHSFVTSINQNRNVLMQEIDRFNGIMITTTNGFENFDPAIIRRIARHIHFKLPEFDQRLQLFKLHLPNKDIVKNIDFNKLAKCSNGLSGGDIRNICFNAMERASMDNDMTKWKLELDHLMLELESVKISKFNNEHRFDSMVR